MFPALTYSWIGLFGWLNSSMDLRYFYVNVLPRPLVRWCTLGFTSSRRIYLRFIFPSFILILRKAYRRYVLASRDFVRFLPFCLLVDYFEWNLKNKIFTHHHIYRKSKLYVHNINIVHNHDTCAEASALGN